MMEWIREREGDREVLNPLSCGSAISPLWPKEYSRPRLSKLVYEGPDSRDFKLFKLPVVSTMYSLL
jgi:hypothetical protein